MNAISKKIDGSKTLTQIVPLILTFVVLGVLITILHASIVFFNLFPVKEPVALTIRWYDVAIGITIYLKTSIDFAIFMGRLMAASPGWRSRIAIEIGTAFGNAAGTIIVIGLWVLFKDVHLLLALMVFLASLVLFELAHGSLEHFENWESHPGMKKTLYRMLKVSLDRVRAIISPLLSRIMPDISAKLKGSTDLPWKRLLAFSVSVPFILGLDDFAGYVPLFSVINVYGFSIGVISAHTILNIFLFLSPKRTILAVKNDMISFLGTIAFIGLGLFGLWETVRIISELFIRS